MRTIDSDAHVIETARTWDFIDPSDRKHKPLLVSSPELNGREYWLVDGESWGAARFSDRLNFREQSERTGRDMDTSREAREMDDIAGRLRHMDELGMDIQVLYPTLFLNHGTTRAATDVALCRSYNRWLGSIWAKSSNRLPWCVLPPLLSIPDALEEIRWGKQNGACGVFMRGMEGERLLNDPYFYPVYEEAQKLDLPITVHVANSNRGMMDLLSQNVVGSGNFWILRLTLVGTFHLLAMSEVPRVFPKLRIGFIEGTSQWLPLVHKDITRRQAALGRKEERNILEKNRFYVTCQTDDDLAYVMGYVGEDHLIVGTDYGHNDHASELGALKALKTSGALTEAQHRKIVDTNAARFYGFAA